MAYNVYCLPSELFLFVSGSSIIYVLRGLVLLQFTQCAGSEFQLLITLLIKSNFLDIQSEPSFEQFIIISSQSVIINFKNTSLLISYLPSIIMSALYVIGADIIFVLWFLSSFLFFLA